MTGEPFLPWGEMTSRESLTPLMPGHAFDVLGAMVHTECFVFCGTKTATIRLHVN